jgi:hypothetical protein
MIWSIIIGRTQLEALVSQTHFILHRIKGVIIISDIMIKAIDYYYQGLLCSFLSLFMVIAV